VGAEKRLCVQNDTPTGKGHAGVFDSLSAIRRHSSSIKSVGRLLAGAEVSSYREHPDRLWDSLCFQSSGYRETFLGVKRSVCDADHLFPSGAEVNKWVRSDINTYFLSQEYGIRDFVHLAVIIPSDRSSPIILFITNNRNQGVKQRKAKRNLEKRENVYFDVL